DSRGTWAVVLPFDGEPICARFAEARPAPGGARRTWHGPDPGAWTSSLDEHGFRAGVAAIRDAIAAGDVYQVCLTRRLSAPLPPGADICALGDALAVGNPAPHAAVVRLPSIGCHVASASPERFLRRDGDRGSVEVPARGAVERHPGLVHLVSTVTGRLRAGAGWAELLAATFPPGSVTGAPKLAALDHIARLEPVPRGPYCGAVGWVDADARRGDLNVAIRTFWFADGRVHLGTGGGITWDSTPDGEWYETELKARRLLAVASGTAATAGTATDSTGRPEAGLMYGHA